MAIRALVSGLRHAHPRRSQGRRSPPRRPGEAPSARLRQPPAAIHQQGDAGDEAGLVARQEQRGVRHVPGGAHAPAERHLPVALRRDLRVRAAGAGARVSTAIGVSISPGRMVLQRMPCLAFWNATCSVKAIIAALVAL